MRAATSGFTGVGIVQTNGLRLPRFMLGTQIYVSHKRNRFVSYRAVSSARRNKNNLKHGRTSSFRLFLCSMRQKLQRSARLPPVRPSVTGGGLVTRKAPSPDSMTGVRAGFVGGSGLVVVVGPIRFFPLSRCPVLLTTGCPVPSAAWSLVAPTLTEPSEG